MNTYYSVKLDTCVPEPTSYDGEHDIRYDLVFSYG